MSKHSYRHQSGRVGTAGATASHPTAPDRPRRRLIGLAVAAGVAVGLAASGCGGPQSSGSDRETRRAEAAAAVPAVVVAARVPSRRAAGSDAASRARRMKEYRQYIVGLYRVPASAQARGGEDQLDALRRGLTNLYGSGAPRQQPRHGARS